MHQPSPEDLYRAEKEKARRERNASHDGLMAEAQRAFDQRLEEGRAARKGGRPKKEAARVAPKGEYDEILAPPPARPAPAAASAAPAAPAAEKSAPKPTVTAARSASTKRERESGGRDGRSKNAKTPAKAGAKAAVPAGTKRAGAKASSKQGTTRSSAKRPAKAGAAKSAGKSAKRARPAAKKTGGLSKSARQPAGRGKERKSRR